MTRPSVGHHFHLQRGACNDRQILRPAIEVVRDRVVEEGTLLEIREINGLRWPVKVLRRALLIMDRSPWTRLLNTLHGLRRTFR